MDMNKIALYMTAFIIGWIVARPSAKGVGRLLTL